MFDERLPFSSSMQLRFALVLVAACSSAPSKVAPRPLDSEVAALRAKGPPALRELLAKYDAMPRGPDRDALARTIDAVAAQRYATYSRMYWYTDLEEAKRVAREAGKPILSLRLLGRLDEDLSCANSRYFRVALYANKELSAFLRDSFVLHWSSERPVPRVTIDYGDGRRIERTLTGNSAHYVLDHDGLPIDVLPGNYAPSLFRSELTEAVALFEKLRPGNRSAMLLAHHGAKRAAHDTQWAALPKVLVQQYRAIQRQTAPYDRYLYPKYLGEAPVFEVIDLGVKPEASTIELEAWAHVGLALLGARPHTVDAPPAHTNGQFRLRRTNGIPEAAARLADEQGALLPHVRGDLEILDAQSRALAAELGPLEWSASPKPLAPLHLDSVLADFERAILAETATNELTMRPRIRDRFVEDPNTTFEAFNTWLYAIPFRTPAHDPWLGLAPHAFLALPADGLVQMRGPI